MSALGAMNRVSPPCPALLAEPIEAVVLHAQHALREPARPGAMGKYRNVQIRLSRRPAPTLGRGEVLLEMSYVGICGSDIHALESDAEGYAASSVPAANWHRPQGLRLGHEYTAFVRAVGPAVSRRWLGRPVTGDSLIPCGDCVVCLDGQPNHCPGATLIGLECDGVFGDFAVVPASSLHALDPLVAAMGQSAFEAGVLAEPLGVAANALKAGVKCLPRRYPRALLICGGGPLGLMGGMVGQLLGFDPIAIVEPNLLRRNLAGRLGLYACVPRDLQNNKSQVIFGAGATVVLDACGVVAPNDLIAALRPGGVIISVARTGNESLWPDDLMITRGIRRVCARGHVGHLPWLLRQMTNGRLDPRPLITRRLQGLKELSDWLRHPERFANEGKVVCRVGAGTPRQCFAN